MHDENNEYPDNDNEYREVEVTKVRGQTFTASDGWSFCLPDDAEPPRVGQSVRFYGRGIGYRVRGVFIDGRKLFYRTEADDDEQADVELFGADAADWLKRWDAGQAVWSVEMGGLGPGYEQAIQITVAEVLRIMLAASYDHAQWTDETAWDRDRDDIRTRVLDDVAFVKRLGLSGAQFGAAMQLAAKLYMRGPRQVMRDLKANGIEDRRIQVSKNFPGAGGPDEVMS